MSLKIKKGTNRIVFIFKKYVVKIPNFTHSWQNFIVGILSNIRENETYKYNKHKTEINYLCPSLFCFGGFLQIMLKAKPMTSEDYYVYYEMYVEQIKKYFPGDDNYTNYGFLNGRPVKIDYGSHE